jgi:hypothetical protein
MKMPIRVEAREILFVFIMTLLIALTPLKAYGQQQDGDKLVYVPQRYVSAEGLTHVTAPTSSVTNVLPSISLPMTFQAIITITYVPTFVVPKRSA